MYRKLKSYEIEIVLDLWAWPKGAERPTVIHRHGEIGLRGLINTVLCETHLHADIFGSVASYGALAQAIAAYERAAGSTQGRGWANHVQFVQRQIDAMEARIRAYKPAYLEAYIERFPDSPASPPDSHTESPSSLAPAAAPSVLDRLAAEAKRPCTGPEDHFIIRKEVDRVVQETCIFCGKSPETIYTRPAQPAPGPSSEFPDYTDADLAGQYAKRSLELRKIEQACDALREHKNEGALLDANHAVDCELARRQESRKG